MAVSSCECEFTISYACVQAKFCCTTNRAKKIVASLAAVALTAAAISFLIFRGLHIVSRVCSFVFSAIVPVSVLVINVVVACLVRRAATNAAANLGVQPHHQSTSSNSPVPTVMLISTSFIYVLLYSSGVIIRLIHSLIIGEDRDRIENRNCCLCA